MLTFLFHAHSGWRYLVLLLMVVTTIKLLVGWLRKDSWQNIDLLLVRGTTASVHIQVLLGLVLYIMMQAWSLPHIHDGHIFPAVIGAGFVTAATVWAKRKPSSAERFKWAFIGNLIALVSVSVAVWFITIVS